VFKGKKMAGHMGQDHVTTLNLTIFKVDVERGLILIKGAVPGTEGGFVKIRDAVKSAPPADLPRPGAFKGASGSEAPSEPAAEQAAAAEQTNGGEE
jgi:large subunit ribosomal protein L3